MTLMRTGLVTRDPHRVAANPARVITRLFVPGQEGFELQESRAGVVLKRILALTDDDVQSSLDDVITRFDGRHRDLVGTFRRHARELADRLDPDIHLSDARILLLGAAFTSEYAIEGAALCNPSIVAHPDQTDMAAGSLRFVMSVRGIGEGHRSSIGFRTGVVDAAGRATIDEPARFATTGSVSGALLEAAVFRGELDRVGDCRRGRELRLRRARRPLHAIRPRRATRQSPGPPEHPRTRGAHGRPDPRHRRSVLCRRIPQRRTRFPSACCGRRWRPSRPAWRTPASSASSTTTARSPTTPPTRPTADPTSASSCSRPRTSSPSPPRRWSGRPPPTRVWRCSPGEYTVATPPCRDRTASPTPSPSTDHLAVWTSASPCQQPAEAWEALQLGNCGPPIETDAGLAGAHPRRRPDAHV